LQAQIPLSPGGAVWRYSDTGLEPSGNWKALGYGDSGWSNGVAPLGFGDGDEATVVNRTNALGATNITVYFRRQFTVPDPSLLTNLLLRLWRDDGAVVYLNEVEVFRSNMPTGAIAYTNFAATTAQDDGNQVYALPVSPAVLLMGDNILAVEVHQANLGSSDLSFELELSANVQFQPPAVAITSPVNDASIGSATVNITASASDPDGLVGVVEFYEGGFLLGMDTNAPFSLVWSNFAPGSYTLSAVAIDLSGLSATSAPVTVSVPPRIVASGTVWHYLDDGSDPGTDWRNPGFDDSGWSNGVAQLGFGNDGEATLLNRTNAAGGTNITFYFRQQFIVPAEELAGWTNLVVRLLRDDGGVVYLNGTEVFRDNMPAGPVDYLTLAASTVGNDSRFHATNVSPGLLMAGTNLLAAEVHQAALTSSDIGFDLELRPNVPPTPPVVALTRPANGAVFTGPTNLVVEAETSDLDSPVSAVTFYWDGAMMATDTTEPYSAVVPNLAAGSYTVVAVAVDTHGLSATSAPVSFTVVMPPVFSTLIPTGSVWKYLDIGANQGTNWRSPGFDDNLWPSGPGKLGTNDGARTVIRISTSTASATNVTTYFRHAFMASGPAAYTNLAFRVLRDDGVVAYLNGAEIFRMNMNPTNEIFFNTVAMSAVGGTNEFFYFPTNISPAFLRAGMNLLAVELHQTLNTSDAGFDLGLVGVSPPNQPPALGISQAGGVITITWGPAGFVLQEAPALESIFTDVMPQVTASPFALTNPPGMKFYRLRSGP
jgi:hypothetical protein